VKNAPDICVEDNLAYIVNGIDLCIVNVEDSNNPRSVGSKGFPSFTLGVDVSSNYAYVAVNDKGLDILDISNPVSPVFVGNYTPPVPPLYDPDGYAYKVIVNGNYAYVCDGIAGVGLRILDITQKNNPIQLSQFNLLPAYASNISADNRYVYLTFTDGIRIVDAINPSSPKIIDYYSSENLFDICINDTLIFASSGQNGAYIFRKPIITDILNLPEEYILLDNYPNPFNPQTTIRYSLPEASIVRIKIYDISGKLVDSCVDKYQNAGHYSIEWNAKDHESGIYFCRMETEEKHFIQKMLLIK